MSSRPRRPRVRRGGPVEVRPASVTVSRSLLAHTLIAAALLAEQPTRPLLASIVARVNRWRPIALVELEDALTLAELLGLIPPAPDPAAELARLDLLAVCWLEAVQP